MNCWGDLITEKWSKHNVSFMAIGSKGRRFESSQARHFFLRSPYFLFEHVGLKTVLRR